MKARIGSKLTDLETRHEIKILYACESGSRAWGFPSSNSDYDVRFIYVQQASWYLSVFPQRDVIEEPIDETLDINGWDLKKALQLMYKANPTLTEWLQSSIIYREDEEVSAELKRLAAKYFSPVASFHHYLSMAKGNFRVCLQGDSVKIKKYFYVLRPILACRWIIEQESMPPLLFDELLAAQVRSAELLRDIQGLLARKMAGEELDFSSPIASIDRFIRDELVWLDEHKKGLRAARNTDVSDLNNLFLRALRY